MDMLSSDFTLSICGRTIVLDTPSSDFTLQIADEQLFWTHLRPSSLFRIADKQLLWTHLRPTSLFRIADERLFWAHFRPTLPKTGEGTHIVCAFVLLTKRRRLHLRTMMPDILRRARVEICRTVLLVFHSSLLYDFVRFQKRYSIPRPIGAVTFLPISFSFPGT